MSIEKQTKSKPVEGSPTSPTFSRWDTISDSITFVTPDAVIRCAHKGKEPRGIDWDILDAEKLAEIPLLRELKPRAARTSKK